MKKITFVFVFFSLLFNPIIITSQDFFFYHFGQKQTLQRIEGFVSVKFKENVSSSSKSSVEKLFAPYFKQEMDFKTGRENSGSSEVSIYKLKEQLGRNTIATLVESVSAMENVESAGFGYSSGDKVIHFTTNEIIVKFKYNITQNELAAVNGLYRTRIIEKISMMDNVYLLAVESNGNDGKDNVFDVSNKFTLLQNVELAQPNFIRYGMLLGGFEKHRVHTPPNDSMLPRMWHIKNNGNNIHEGVNGIPGCDMNVIPAWEITAGNPNVMISITDTGVDTNHTDLRPNLCDRGLWYDAYDNDQQPYDEYFHGTGVSGCAVATGNNIAGTVGVAYNCSLLPVRVFGPWPNALTTDLILGKGLTWAWKHGASVINCSWGGGIPTPLVSLTIKDAVRYGRNNKGTLIFGGSGNDNLESVLYPASMEEVIGVGGVSPCNERKSRSSCDFNGIDSSTYWGASYGEGMELVAPCSYIGTTELMGGWCICGNGTSCSSPLAAGVAGLVISKNVNLSYDSVKMVIERSCVKVGSYSYNIQKQNGLWNNEMGYGRIDALAALNMTPAGTGVIGDKVSPIVTIYPPESQIFNGNINFTAKIIDNISVAAGRNSPRIYYRTLQHPGTIQSYYGISLGNNMFKFNLPVIPVSEGFYYYISAQDEALEPNVITYPIGGKGITPPGNIAPQKFMFVRNSSLYDTVFASSNVPIRISGTQETSFVSVINNVPGKIVCDVDCSVDITHTFDADLTLTLISPSGTEIILFGGIGWEGDGFSNTTLDDDASIAIDSSAAVPPFTGSFKPLDKLWLFDGENSGGQWKLQLTDNGRGDGGTLNSWSLKFKYAESEYVNIPGKFALVRTYPNPFNPTARIVFNVPYTSNIRISVYDLLGREVAVLVNGTRTARLEDYVDFSTNDPAINNGNGFASGVYFVKMMADGNFIDSKKMVLLK